ncbi:glycosyltransferase [Rhodopseudomonas palustris]|uniref:glycosyltransferase n=1 Tax=Rhodopseudomonas palustris TaxID=1076 RepID=UPI000E5C36BD|nr:glycosyltransferase [Rhodopseudomonas palustris]QLH73064.1 glycosyltransferase [Rhodopseudomonas palustris]RHZ91222.1 glycosyltransferase [Rhodopseudomonas palustris]
MPAPTFSIVVPTYNQAQYLGACLDSIASQTDGDWEAIVVDDGSTDGSAALADNYAARDPRFRVIHQPNGGVASALNEGLRQARGQWIHWLSSDDLFDPRKLEINREQIRQHPDCKFFFSFFRLLRESTQELSDHGLWGPLPDRESQIPTLFFRNYISGITICVERTAWQSVGSFDPSLRYAQDYDMWLRLLARFPARFIDQWTVTNRNHALQGSEVFPQACYYDTAKAAIQFLNQHRFEALFPLMDLTDPAQAVRALDHALTITSDPSAFLYALGWHPALLWRALEWIAATERRDPVLGRRLRTRARWSCRRNARAWSDRNGASIWTSIGAALAMEGLTTVYRSLDPVDIAVDRYFTLRAAGDPASAALAAYLKQFHGLSLPEPASTGDQGGTLAVVLDHATGEAEALAQARPVVRAMAARGWRTVLFTAGAPSFRLDFTTPVISGPRNKIVGLAAQFQPRCVLSADPTNAAFPHGFPVLHVSAAADSAVLAGFVTDLSCEASTQPPRQEPPPTSRIPLVFLTRALHGGGAERALQSVAGALNSQLFDVHIVPLFNSAISPEFGHATVAPSFEAVWFERTKTEVVQQQVPLPQTPPTAETMAAPRPRFPAWVTFIASKLTSAQKQRIRASIAFKIARLGWRAFKAARRELTADAPPPCVDVALPPPSEELSPAAARPGIKATALTPYDNMADYIAQILAGLGHSAIVISLMEEATIVAWLASLRTPMRYLAWLHTVESLYLDQIFPAPAQRAKFDILLHAAVARSERCVFPSRGCCDDLTELYELPPDHFQCIYNPIDLATVRRLSELPFERPLAPHPNVPILVSLGRLSPEKDHAHLLKALSLLRQRGRDFLCLIIGDGDHVGEITRLIEHHALADQVRLLGAVQNPFPYLAAADALILTSKFESFALVLVEAMALEAVPVAVDCPTGPREVLDCGQAGVLVPPGDERALADAIEHIVWSEADHSALLATMADRLKSFDIATVALQWERLVGKVHAKATLTDEACPDSTRPNFESAADVQDSARYSAGLHR